MGPRTVKINDPYPAYSGNVYSMHNLVADPEVVKDLSELTAKIMHDQNIEMENWLRRVSIPLIDEGYRLGELVLIISNDRFWRKDKPLRALMPARDINPFILLLRVSWRKWFPYRLPDGRLFSRMVKEEV